MTQVQPSPSNQASVMVPAADPSAERAAYIAGVTLHKGAKRDSEWATRAEATLKSNLVQDESAFARELDCRQTSCVVRFVWPDYPAAMRGAAKVGTHWYGLPCRQTIMLLGEAGHQSEGDLLLFDCARDLGGSHD